MSETNTFLLITQGYHLSCRSIEYKQFYRTTAPDKLLTLQIPPLAVTSLPTPVFGGSPSLLSSLTTPASKATSRSAVVVKPGCINSQTFFFGFSTPSGSPFHPSKNTLSPA